MIDLILAYAPYALTILNALISFLTYRRTGKVVKSPLSLASVELDEIKKLKEFHEQSAKKLEQQLKKEV